MKYLLVLLTACVFMCVSAHAQSGLGVNEAELTAATLAQMAEEARSEKISQLFEKLSSAYHVEITHRGPIRFPTLSLADEVQLTFNNGEYTYDNIEIPGSRTLCTATLLNSGKDHYSEKGARIRVTLHSIDRYDLAEQKVYSATWKGIFLDPDARVTATATMECHVGWASLGSLLTQPDELSASVIQYNLGENARIFRKDEGRW